MCVINLSFPQKTGSIVSLEGQYKKINDTNWNSFPISLSNPQTPNITEAGTYDLRVRAINSAGTGEWSVSTFEIDCDVVEILPPVFTGITFNGQNCCDNDSTPTDPVVNVEDIQFLVEIHDSDQSTWTQTGGSNVPYTNGSGVTITQGEILATYTDQSNRTIELISNVNQTLSSSGTLDLSVNVPYTGNTYISTANVYVGKFNSYITIDIEVSNYESGV